MRFLKGFRLVLALALGASSARAQVRFAVPETPVFVQALLPSSISPALATSLPALALTPSLLPSPAFASPQLILPAQALQPVRPAPAESDPFEAGRYAGYFDGAAAKPVDGAPVYPRVMTGAQETTLRLPLQLSVVRQAVERSLPALRESVALGSWSGPHTTLDDSCCGDAAPKLAALLRARGVPARLVEAEFHYYVILDLPEGQVVVDPTVRQFFGRKDAPRSIPAVFVGTIGELTALFAHHKAAKTTRYDVHRIYFSEAATREEQLRALEAEILRGGPRDLEPLRREMGVPPAPSSKPEPPRLIL